MLASLRDRELVIDEAGPELRDWKKGKCLPVISDAFAVSNAQQLLKAGEQLVLDAAAYKQACSGQVSILYQWVAVEAISSVSKCHPGR